MPDHRRMLIGLGVGVLVCAIGILYQVTWWSSACWAFADEVQSRRVRPEDAADVSRGFIGHRAEYVLCWVVIAAALALAAIVAGLIKRRSGDGVP